MLINQSVIVNNSDTITKKGIKTETYSSGTYINNYNFPLLEGLIFEQSYIGVLTTTPSPSNGLLVSAGGVKISSNGTTRDFKVSYEYIEFDKDLYKTIQKGVKRTDDWVNSANIPINAVDMSKTLIFYTFVNTEIYPKITLTSPTNLKISVDVGMASAYICWAVVEFK